VDDLADRRLGAHFIGVLVRPRETLRLLADQPSARPGASAIGLLALFWSMFLLLLWSAGRSPSFVLVPIPRDIYYLVQGFAMMPVLTALFWLHSEIAHRICAAAGGKGIETGVRSALGFAYAAPMLLAHVAPEAIAYLTGGFDVLAKVAPITMGIASLWVWALSSGALRIAHGVRWPIAVGAAFAGLLVQALAGALFIR
jgi:hypothetical protein